MREICGRDLKKMNYQLNVNSKGESEIFVPMFPQKVISDLLIIHQFKEPIGAAPIESLNIIFTFTFQLLQFLNHASTTPLITTSSSFFSVTTLYHYLINALAATIYAECIKMHRNRRNSETQNNIASAPDDSPVGKTCILFCSSFCTSYFPGVESVFTKLKTSMIRNRNYDTERRRSRRALSEHRLN
ncbi:unnamed protein product [Vicia faba]|uniref:Uncharacterized protein n=1 Tax=Vicia faba TaxID=3906 RepID=A0AAV0ZF18_VICFA|nr:unnamed protein product [Vicia faba]